MKIKTVTDNVTNKKQQEKQIYTGSLAGVGLEKKEKKSEQNYNCNL